MTKRALLRMVGVSGQSCANVIKLKLLLLAAVGADCGGARVSGGYIERSAASDGNAVYSAADMSRPISLAVVKENEREKEKECRSGWLWSVTRSNAEHCSQARM